MSKKISYKKIETSIPEDAFISRIEGLVGKVNNVTLDGTFSNVKVYEVEDTMFVLVDFEDCSGKMPALMAGARDDDFKIFIEEIIMRHEYRVRGNVSLLDNNLDDNLPFIDSLKGKQVLCITAIDDLSSKKLFGVDIYRLYNYDLNKAYDFISTNTDYLDGISIDKVKTIHFSYNKDIIILLNDGSLLFNGKKRQDNIKTLVFISGLSIFSISNDNVITCLTGDFESTKFLNSENCKYKKILYTPLVIVALNYDNTIRLYGTITDQAIDYKRLIDVDDIGYVEENDDIVVMKDNKVYSLFLENDYTSEAPDIMVVGDSDDTFITY